MPFWHPNQLGRSPNLQITAESMKSISGELWFANNPRTNVLSVNRSHVWHLYLSFGLIYDMHRYWGLQAVQTQTGQSCTKNMDITGLPGMAYFQFFFWSIAHTRQWLTSKLLEVLWYGSFLLLWALARHFKVVFWSVLWCFAFLFWLLDLFVSFSLKNTCCCSQAKQRCILLSSAEKS